MRGFWGLPKGVIWIEKHSVSQNAIKRLNVPSDAKTLEDFIILLAFGLEFNVYSRDKSYFVSPWVAGELDEFGIVSPSEKILYETDDLDDLGENARSLCFGASRRSGTTLQLFAERFPGANYRQDHDDVGKIRVRENPVQRRIPA